MHSRLAFDRGLPSQSLTTLLVRSYRTFAPLPDQVKIYLPFYLIWRYFSVALSSRSHALDVIQRSGLYESPDFPQRWRAISAANRLLFP